MIYWYKCNFHNVWKMLLINMTPHITRRDADNLLNSVYKLFTISCVQSDSVTMYNSTPHSTWTFSMQLWTYQCKGYVQDFSRLCNWKLWQCILLFLHPARNHSIYEFKGETADHIMISNDRFNVLHTTTEQEWRPFSLSSCTDIPEWRSTCGGLKGALGLHGLISSSTDWICTDLSAYDRPCLSVKLGAR